MDAPGGSPAVGAAPSPEPAAQVTPVSASPSQPAQDSITISRQEHQSLVSQKGKAQSYDGLINRFRNEFGAQSVDDVFSNLGRLKTIESDATIKSIIDTLSRPPQGQAQPSNGQPLDPAKLPQHVNELVEQKFAEAETRRQQAEFTTAAKIENELIGTVVNDARFKPFFTDKSFEDNFEGKGTKMGRAVAALVDAEVASLADKVDGRARPLTDSAKMKQAFDNVHSILQELRAQMLLAASGNPVPGITPPQNGVTPKPDPNKSPTDLWPTREEVNATFKGMAAARV